MAETTDTTPAANPQSADKFRRYMNETDCTIYEMRGLIWAARLVFDELCFEGVEGFKRTNQFNALEALLRTLDTNIVQVVAAQDRRDGFETATN